MTRAGQVPGPLFYVDQGDDIQVKVNNLTALPHTIHWHGLLPRGSWKMDGVPDVTQEGIPPGDSFTYKMKAEPSGTLWYHCHVNVNEHVALRGMWGPFIVRPKKPTALEQRVTKDFVLILSDSDSKWVDKPRFGGLPGDAFNYFTINGKAFPDDEPLRARRGDVVRMRFIGAGDLVHSIHVHGHVMKVAPRRAGPLDVGSGCRSGCDAPDCSTAPGRHDHRAPLFSLIVIPALYLLALDLPRTTRAEHSLSTRALINTGKSV